MKVTTRSLIALATVGVASAAGYAALTGVDEPPPLAAAPQTPALPSAGGVSGNMHFVDQDGNPRIPTDAEMRALAQELKRDLARMAGPHAGKRYDRTEASGAVAATVATSDLVFLTATTNPDGSVSIGHSRIGADDAAPQAAGNAPEM